MYQNSHSRNGYGSSSSRSQWGQSRFSRGGRRGGSFGGSRGRGNSIDISKYINRNPADTVEEVYIPTLTIENLNIHEKLKANIVRKGYTKLTPIQDQTIPLIIEGKDLIGIANTGTGKTAAFLIPLIHKVSMNNREKVLIMAPTRELAQQINEELRSLTMGLNLYSALCIGGTNMFNQKRDLMRYNINFLICTPGRIRDLADRNWVNLSLYSNIIIDEFDRMFDMGFQKDIHVILEKLPQQRQSLFFSATISPEIESTFQKYLNNPEKVSINQKVSAVNIMQDIIQTPFGTKKIDQLHDLLIKEEFQKVIIFIKTKFDLKRLEDELIQRGFSVESIHGNKTQPARMRALSNFKQNRIKILIATDVAARGLDINNVSHVINYDQPATHEDYIHRIGRTGRGDNKGVALTFV